MTVFCIECGTALDAAAAVCTNCGASQTIDDDAPIAAPTFPTAAVIAVKPPAEPAEEEPSAPDEDELDLPAPTFPTAAVMAVTPTPPPPSEPEPEPVAEEPELPAPSFPTAAVMAVPPPPPAPPAPEPPAQPAGLQSGDPLAAYLGAAPAPPQPAPAPAAAAPPVEPPTASLEDPASPEPAPAAPSTAFCAKCGQTLAPAAQFCGACGTPRAAAAQPATPPPSPPPGGPPRTSAPADWQASLPAPFRALPVDLLAACALMAVAGLFTLWPVLDILPDMLDLLTSSESFSRSLGLLALALWLVLAFVVAACFLLAWRIAHADRLARGLTYVVLGGFAASVLIGNVHTTGMTIAMLASAAAVAVLALAPGPRAFFAAGEQGGHPEGLVVARTLLTAWSAILIVVGLLFLPIGSLADRYVVVGVLFILLGGAAILLNRRLAEGDPLARIAVSASAVVYLVLLFVLEERNASLLLPLAMAVGIAVYLWLPADVQRYFANRGAAQT